MSSASTIEPWLVIHYPDDGPSCLVGPFSDPKTLAALGDYMDSQEEEGEGCLSVGSVKVSRDIVDHFLAEFESAGLGDCPDCYTFDPATKTYALTERGRDALAEIREKDRWIIQCDPATGLSRKVAIDE